MEGWPEIELHNKQRIVTEEIEACEQSLETNKRYLDKINAEIQRRARRQKILNAIGIAIFDKMSKDMKLHMTENEVDQVAKAVLNAVELFNLFNLREKEENNL